MEYFTNNTLNADLNLDYEVKSLRKVIRGFVGSDDEWIECEDNYIIAGNTVSGEEWTDE